MTTELKLSLHLSTEHDISFKLALLLRDNNVTTNDIYVYPFGNEDTTLLEIIRDVYLITKFDTLLELNRNNQENLQHDFAKKNSFWNVFIVIIEELIKLSYANYENIIDDKNYADAESLFNKKGWNYSVHVEQLGEPFITRYKIFHIFSLLHSNIFISRRFGGCTEIICNYNKFVQFWNVSISKLEELEISIQEKEVHVLKSKFSKITNSKIYKNKFKKRFIDDGCFLKANVIDTNGNYQDVLCFSGLKQFDGSDYLSIAINDIVNSGVFHNPYLVKVNDNIRYYITHDKYITLGDAKTNSKTLNPRMFSCCERKTFADYDWSKCRSYKMTIKYEPCALCEISVKKHSDKYNGTIICGKSESLKPIDKAKYDSIAQVIYDSVHKT